ncbi:hypothetical protein [Draconibacterium sp.]|uniref:hypothetical protein n=1 Tax=Draconibacterium sp. TaxID=1965318 RepID=UPI0035697F35
MKTKKRNKDKSSWITGGTTMMGLGVGFILLKYSVMYFLASLLIGIAVGLVVTPFLPIHYKSAKQS